MYSNRSKVNHMTDPTWFVVKSDSQRELMDGETSFCECLKALSKTVPK
jgi:hypothetical protein